MEHYFGIPKKDENQKGEGTTKLGYGFSLDLPTDQYGGSFSHIDFFYNEIKFDYMDHVFLITLASFLEAFSANRMQNNKAYEADKYFTMKSIIIDDLHMLSCTILYRVTGNDEVLKEEIFLDQTEAYLLVKRIHYALSINKTYTLHQV